MFTIILMCVAVVATACVWAYLYVTKKRVSVYITTIDDDMNKVTRGKKRNLALNIL
jgi:LPS O-antigen subunit length determinant protein (WzzB/FepE family)